MTITVVPPFPLRTQGKPQAQYSAEFEASMTALPQAITDLNAVGSAYALATNATSTTSNTIGTGAKSFTTQPNLGYQVGQTLRIANTSTNFMTGEVTSYNVGTGALVMNITSTSGSGTFTSWFLSQSATGANNANGVSFTPAGNIAATNVQSAIQELDTEKLSNAAGAVTGTNLEDIITGASVGSLTAIPVITYDANGRITATSSVVNYPCRAWVNFNGTGTVAIRGSGNVSSITDDGTGLYRVNLTSAMPDTNYAVNVTAGGNAGRSTFGTLGYTAQSGYTVSTSSFSIQTANGSAAGSTELDAAIVCVSVFR